MARTRHISEVISEMFGVAPKSKYQNYLQSEHWQRTRTRILQKRGCKCEVCGIKHRLQVHHLNYERVGNELDSDLKVLCWACHEREHGIR